MRNEKKYMTVRPETNCIIKSCYWCEIQILDCYQDDYTCHVTIFTTISLIFKFNGALAVKFIFHLFDSNSHFRVITISFDMYPNNKNIK